MEIIEYIQKDQDTRRFKVQDKLKLKNPVSYFFLGEFGEDEFEQIIKIHKTRIGDSKKIQYAWLTLKHNEIEETNETTKWPDCRRIYLDMGIEQPDTPFYSLDSRQRVSDNAKASNELEREIDQYFISVSNEVTEYSYPNVGNIRINLVVSAHDLSAALVVPILRQIKEKFERVFINHVIMDVYCILDEALETGDSKQACIHKTIYELETVSKNPDFINMLYFLSNQDSFGVLNRSSRANVLAPIALLSILKDGISTSVQSHMYNDQQFQEVSSSSDRKIYSAGLMKFEKMDMAIELIVYKTLLSFMNIGREFNKEDLCQELGIDEKSIDVCSRSIISRLPDQGYDMLYGIMKNENARVSELVGMSNEEAVEYLYGRNLSLFAEANFSVGFKERIQKQCKDNIEHMKQQLKQLYLENNYTIYDIKKFLEEDGIVFFQLNQLNAEYESIYEDAKTRLKQWAREPIDMRKSSVKISGSSEFKVYYSLAYDYITKQLEVQSSQCRYELAHAYKMELSGIRKSFSESVSLIQDSIHQLDETILQILSEESPLRAGNCENYYGGIVRLLIQGKYRDEYLKMMKYLNRSISEKALNSQVLFQELVRFTRENLLEEAQFHEEFTAEMLNRLLSSEQSGENLQLYTKEQVYELAYHTIFSNKTYNIRVIDDGTMKQEVCLFVSQNNQFVDYIVNRLQHAKETYKVNIFYEKDMESMDILYLEGCFHSKMLGRYQGYVKAYENLIQKSADFV